MKVVYLDTWSYKRWKQLAEFRVYWQVMKSFAFNRSRHNTLKHEMKDRKGSGGGGEIAVRRFGTSVLRREIIHDLRNIH